MIYLKKYLELLKIKIATMSPMNKIRPNDR